MESAKKNPFFFLGFACYPSLPQCLLFIFFQTSTDFPILTDPSFNFPILPDTFHDATTIQHRRWLAPLLAEWLPARRTSHQLLTLDG